MFAGAGPVHLRAPVSYTPQHLIDKILTSRSALEGERKQVTVLFCDIAGSTALAESLGAERMHTLLSQFFELALSEVHRYEGTVNQFLGDGFMALFGAPLAHEDHAHRAVLAALAVRRSLAALPVSSNRGGKDAASLSVRVGLNTGPVVVGSIGDNLRMDYTAVGDTTNLANRLQMLAEPGSIHMSEATYRLVRDAIDCEPLGLRTVKGKTEPVRIFRVNRPYQELPVAAGRPVTTPFVGREAELQAIRHSIARLAEGHGAVIGIVGDTGIGKTRLLTEARSFVESAGVRWLEGQTVSFGRMISYGPLLQMVRTIVGATERDDHAAVWGKLEQTIGSLFGEESDQTLPYVAMLMSVPIPERLAERTRYLDAEAIGRQIVLALIRMIERLARERPLALVVEDLQWADDSTIDFLGHLLVKVNELPLLLFAVARSDPLSPVGRLWARADRLAPNRYTKIPLGPLARDESSALVRGWLRDGEALGRLTELLVQKSEGNPYFLEEILRSLIDNEILVPETGTGRWTITRTPRELTIPDTVQATVMARIDRLEDDAKRLLKVASVVGRAFLYRVLEAIADADRELARDLSELERSELIRKRRPAPELEYEFRHGMVHEVAYETLLVKRRRELHRKVAVCLETLFAERLDDVCGVLAHHYAEAEVWDKAHEYLIKAGDLAGTVAADAEAVNHYRRAIEVYDRAFGERWDPFERGVLQRKIGEACFRRGEHASATEWLESALPLLGDRRPPTTRWRVRMAIGREAWRQLWHRVWPWDNAASADIRATGVAEEQLRVYSTLGWIDYFETQERLLFDSLRVVNLAERSQARSALVPGLAGIGILCEALHWPRLARHYLGRAIEVSEEIQNPVTRGIAYLGMGLYEENSSGGRSRALECHRIAAEAYREAGDLHGWGTATWQIGFLTFRAGHFATARAVLDEVVRIAKDCGDTQLWGMGLYDLGLIELCTTGPEAAVGLFEQAVEFSETVPDYLSIAIAKSYLGLCYLRQHRIEKARAMVDAANAVIDKRGFGHSAYPARNARAEVCLAEAETAHGRARNPALRSAATACRLALKEARFSHDARADAFRLQGTKEWLSGQEASAMAWWQRSLAAAKTFEIPYDGAKTHFEVGRFSGSPDALDRAASDFAALGAEWDYANSCRVIAMMRRR